jgi:hypothetical protein
VSGDAGHGGVSPCSWPHQHPSVGDDKRSTGFGIQAAACGILLVGALVGIIVRMAHGG